MTIAEIKLDLSMVDFEDAQAEQLIDAMDAVDWVTVAREAIREALYVTSPEPSLLYESGKEPRDRTRLDMDAVQITKIEEDLF